MGNILVGLIVAAALFYLIKRMINVFKGQSSCSCECEGCTPCPQ
ncbi:FeoB-associated Cys-rich membrane protein, partial [Desulfobacter sp.]